MIWDNFFSIEYDRYQPYLSRFIVWWDLEMRLNANKYSVGYWAKILLGFAISTVCPLIHSSFSFLWDSSTSSKTLSLFEKSSQSQQGQLLNLRDVKVKQSSNTHIFPLSFKWLQIKIIIAHFKLILSSCLTDNSLIP